MIDIIIPAHNAHDYTAECVQSIADNTEDYNIILIDNGSDPPYPEAVVRNAYNLGFPMAINQGFEKARAEYVCILNNDTIVTPDWMEVLLAHLKDGIDIIGPYSNYVHGKQQIKLPSVYSDKETLYEGAAKFHKENKGKRETVNWLIGVCLVFRRDLISKIGMFDESFGLGNSEDIDFCLRAQMAGMVMAIAQDCYIHHFGSITHKILKIDYAKQIKTNHDRLVAKWRGQDVCSTQ